MEHIKTSPRDFFLHLLSNIALYYCAIWLITLYYSYIDYVFGSMSYYGYDSGWLPAEMRWAIASLVIVFPVYILVTRFLNRDMDAHPEKRGLRVRKWLMYLTLSLASIALVVDVVALIYQFLSGEFATTFILKVLAVAVVSGLVFAYYYYELRREAGKSAPNRLLFRYIAIALVGISVLTGFFIVGSPTKARERQYDQQRINDLGSIQWQIVNYWQSKGTLPTDLSQLSDPISGYALPRDPEGRTYEYSRTGTTSFELCATFNQESGPQSERSMVKYPGMYENENWQHGVGRTCFDRTIDPQLYPVRPR